MDADVEPLRFAIIAEGPTDQHVIKHILEGVFGADGHFIDVQFTQPKPSGHGGWELVKAHLTEGSFQEALQFNDFIIVQIDTDVSEHVHFGVLQSRTGQTLSDDELCEAICTRLQEWGGEALQNSEEVAYAICVHSLECWLLPLVERNARKSDKTNGCGALVDRTLRRQNKKNLSYKGAKSPLRYEEVSKPFRKRRDLEQACARQPSLLRFVEELDRIRQREGVETTLEALARQREHDEAW